MHNSHQEEQMGAQSLEDELRDLRQQIRAAQRERLDLEAHLGSPEALRSATARALRDRDAVTSPALEEARTTMAADIAELQSQWCSVDKTAHVAERFAGVIDEAPLAVRDHHSAIAVELPEVRRQRDRIAAELLATGLIGVVPEDG